MAVGINSSTLAGEVNLAEAWNGTTWTVEATPQNGPMLFKVSCPSASWCMAAGLAGEAWNGTMWAIEPASPLGGLLFDVSCSSPTACTAVGYYGISTGTAAMADVWDGTKWRVETIPIPSAASLRAVSCASATSCTAVGTYYINAFTAVTFAETLTVGEAPSSTTITATTPSPVVGQPITVEVRVKANPPGGVTPTGTATVSDGLGQSCGASLSGSDGTATGSCSITEDAPGTYAISASYLGDTTFDSSETGTSTRVTVGEASTKTALKLSQTSITYGHEQVEEITVTVSPEFAGVTPTGTVAIKAPGRTLCRITLKAAKGSCALSAKQLGAGFYHLVAKYSGSTDFDSSTSAKKNLTVTT